MNHTLKTMAIVTAIVTQFSCGKGKEAQLHIKIKFDPLQERLDNKGFPATVAAGNAAQSPVMNSIGMAYLELMTDGYAKFGAGTVVLPMVEMASGSEQVIDFSKVKIAKDGETILSVPIKNIPAGQYNWLRTSIPYQNFDVVFNFVNVPFAGTFFDERGTLAMFSGHKSFIGKYKIWNKEDSVNGVRNLGYWAFETKLNPAYTLYDRVFRGQMAEGTSMTLVNPLTQFQATPPNARIIAGKFNTPLSITGDETTDITVTLTFSVNKSFEWEEIISKNGKWDIAGQANTGQPTVERIVDTGFRGVKAAIETK